MKKIVLFALVVLSSALYSPVYSQNDVLTQHNDGKRTGWDSLETILTQSNVNPGNFGKLFVRPVDDQIFAQPLVVSGVNIPSAGAKNVVYVATVNNSIYAFDADSNSKTTPYWQINLTPSGGFRPPKSSDIHPMLCGFSYHDFTGNFGIVGTPVIDKQNNVLYVVSRHVSTSAGVADQGPHLVNGNDVDTAYSSSGFYQMLHAIDIRTGNELPNSPVQIVATANGPGDGNFNGVMRFDPRRNLQRPGLALSNGIVYIAFAAHCDWDNYHGWVLGYDATTLAQKIVYITTPNEGRGGIWMSGAAPAIDDAGNLFVATGNSHLGTKTSTTYPGDNDDQVNAVNTPALTVNRGLSILKLAPNALNNTATALNISSYFTPYNYQYYNDADLDFSTQVLLIPGTNMALAGSKDNNLFLMDQTNLGGYNSTTNNVLQRIGMGANASMHSSFAYFGGSSGHYVYQLSENTLLKAFPVGTNSLGTAVNGTIAGPSGQSGAFLSVSSHGTDPNSSILWINQATPNCNANQALCAGVLRAVKANDVTTELWNSTMNTNDAVGNFGKMSCPTIANGKVYLATFSNWLVVYGPKKTPCNVTNNAALNKSATASSILGGNTASNGPGLAFDGSLTTSWSSKNFSNNEYVQVDLGKSYDICNIIIDWGTNYGKDFDIDVSNDNSTWTAVANVRGNAALADTLPNTFSGRYVRMQGGTSGTGNGYSIEEMAVYGQPSNPCTAPSNLSASAIAENTITLSWTAVSGATGYVVQYKTPEVSSWISDTTATNSISLSALSCGTDYTYQVQTLCASGQSGFTAGSFSTAACSNPCILPTRYSHADLGAIGIAGSSCYANSIFTVAGSGTGIGGHADEFQFCFTNLIGDEFVQAEILTMDQTNPSAIGGLMFRDSASNTSRFVFIGINGGGSIIFSYRTTPGGPVTVVNGSGITYPYWVKLNKTGAQYNAYTSPDGITWTAIGTTVSAGFGIQTVYPGIAVSSGNNTLLSTATLGNYLESSVALPIDLISFTAKDHAQQYVDLQWATSVESGDSYFEVQRSTDGASFAGITRVQAAGNSNTTRYYTAKDPSPVQGLNYYRLKQVDLNGNAVYSPVVAVRFNSQTPPMIYPNPATSTFTVVAGQEAINTVSLYAVSGQLMQTTVNANLATNIPVSVAGLPRGIYIVQIRTASQVYQEKLFKR